MNDVMNAMAAMGMLLFVGVIGFTLACVVITIMEKMNGDDE